MAIPRAAIIITSTRIHIQVELLTDGGCVKVGDTVKDGSSEGVGVKVVVSSGVGVGVMVCVGVEVGLGLVVGIGVGVTVEVTVCVGVGAGVTVGVGTTLGLIGGVGTGMYPPPPLEGTATTTEAGIDLSKI